MNLDLKKKISLIGGAPLVLLLVLTGYNINLHYKAFLLADGVLAGTELASSVSSLIHELQKERGKSVTFIKGTLSKEDLQQQRLSTDQALQNVVALEKSVQDVTPVAAIRERLNAGQADIPETVETYTKVIENYLDLEVQIAFNARGTRAETKMLSMIMLETAKENAGQLRATLTGILTTGAPVSPAQFDSILRMTSAIDANLDSKSADFSKETLDKINKFQKSDSWIFVQQTLRQIIKNADKGNYQRDPKEFFKVITTSIDELRSFVQSTTVESRSIALEEESVHRTSCLMMSVLGCAISLVLLFSIVISIRSITRPVTSVIGSLNVTSTQIAVSTDHLRTATEDISSSVTQSAAALQETSAAITQITSMIAKNAENSENARKLSESSKDQVLAGKLKVQEVNASILDIQMSQNMVLAEIQDSNHKLGQIVELIQEIKDKTRVIDEIVFQTKLLSFNASVEAARAGEHGKGFAVVAVEVGNLARMSGHAAKEISDMLEKSTLAVKQTVEQSSQRIETLMKSANAKVAHGCLVAESCSSMLEAIVKMAGEISIMVAEISAACKEQSVGTTEIAAAITQLDSSTNANANSANRSSQSANELATEMARLNDVINSLNKIIFSAPADQVRADEHNAA